MRPALVGVEISSPAECIGAEADLFFERSQKTELRTLVDLNTNEFIAGTNYRHINLDPLTFNSLIIGHFHLF